MGTSVTCGRCGELVRGNTIDKQPKPAVAVTLDLEDLERCLFAATTTYLRKMFLCAIGVLGHGVQQNFELIG